ncbi:MAG: YicC/YloC family endoribonuclease, partial [Bacteroides sp.]|nr:YicC/YloC family endoribonuclease [Bacteroides sp.]
MIQSMTGYGKVSETIANKKVTIEVKSLNSKNLDLSTRITNAYREKEIEIRNVITKSLERGKVDFSLYIEKSEEDISALPIDENLIQTYYNQLKEISYKYSIPEPSDWLQTLLRMPDVMSKTETSVEISEEEWSAIFKL